MTDIIGSSLLGTVVLDPCDDPELAWPRIRDLGRAGGLAPLPAVRLALAVMTVVGQPHGPAVVEVARIDDARGRHVEAAIHGEETSTTPAPAGLVDARRRHVSAAGPVSWVLTANVSEDAVTGDPSSAALSGAADGGADTRQLRLAVLAAVPRQARRNEQAVSTEQAVSEVLALRRELDESNQGLIALHAELSEQCEALERARAAAQQASKDKADFLANMSHEIRSPMNAVIGFTSLLRATELTGEQAEYTEAVETAGSHLLGLVNGILDLSKIESGLLELEEIGVDLFACAEDAVDMLAAKASDKDLAITALFAPNLPPRIIGDPLRIRQILVNLLANAVKFTTHGHVVVEVTAVTELPAAGNVRQLAFAVRDTGNGIPADRVALLFAPYTQADASTARIHGGTGLGLTICRQLTERMGGAITVASTVGEGSTFTATIRARVAERSAASAEVPAASGNDDLFAAGTQVLVVNGQALVAEAIGRHLISWGAEVVTATSVDDAISRSGDWPRAALAIIGARQPDALAADITRLAAASATPALPIVGVTDMASRAALARGGVLCPSVRTPIRRDHLRKAVIAALGTPAPAAAAPASAAPAAAGSATARPATAAPATAAPAADINPAPAAVAPERAAAPAARRVLYVDDNPLLTGLVERIFARDPTVVVQTTPDGHSAFDLACQQQPDIVLLDLNLSGMSGEALLRQLQADARTRSIPAVIVSGDTAPATIERLTSLGAFAYLTKPFTSSQLHELLNAVGRSARPLRRRGQGQQKPGQQKPGQ